MPQGIRSPLRDLRSPFGGQGSVNRPIINVPGDQTFDVDDLPYDITGISVDDAIETELTILAFVTSGVFSLDSTTGLSFDAGDGTSDASMTFSGDIADLNAALDPFTIAGQANGQATIVIIAYNSTGQTARTISLFVGDQTAPIVSSPTATKVGTSQVNTQVNTNDATGTGYVVLTTSSTTPSAGNIILGLDHLGNAAVDSDSDAPTAGVLGPISFTGLTPATTYYAHWTHRDSNNNAATPVTSSGATTDSVTNPVLTLVLDDLYNEPPVFRLTSSAAGDLTIDFDTSETFPGLGLGDITSFTLAIAEGENDFDRTELNSFYGAVGFLHFTLVDAQPLPSNTLTSRQIRVDNALLAPSNTVLPIILGVAQEGIALSFTRGVYAGYPIPTYGQRWLRNGVTELSTAETYVPVSADVGQDITVEETATNSEGADTATSAAVVPIPAADAWLREDESGFWAREDESGVYLLEKGAWMLEDESGFWLREDGSNFYLLER